MAASDNRRPSGGHTLFRYTAKDIDGSHPSGMAQTHRQLACYIRWYIHY